MPKATLVLVAIAIGVVAAPRATAAPAPEPNYRVTSWSGGDGITFGAVRALVQDQHRYIWLASDAGLVRFDGFRFAVTDLVAGPRQLPLAPLRSVYLARDGSLWAGYGNRHGIYRIANGEVREVFLTDDIPGFVNAMTEDRSGALWVAHDGGLHRFEKNGWTRVSLTEAAASPGVLDIHEDRAGTMWAAASDGIYRRMPGGRFEQMATTDAPVQGLAEEPSGQMWMTDEVHGFRPIGAGASHAFNGRGVSLDHDRTDHLWVATTGQGLWELQREGGSASPWQMVQRLTTRDGLISDELRGFLKDQDGNIWTGSIQGLSRLTSHKVDAVTDLGVVRSVAISRDGTAWVGTTAGLIALKDVTRDGARTTVLQAPVRALRHSGNTVWAATDSGLFRVEGGRASRVPVPGLRLDRVTSMDLDPSGRLWICDQVGGLVRLTPGGPEQVVIGDGPGLPPSLVHLDDSGHAWVAFGNGIVKRVGIDDRVTTYGVAEGLPEGAVNAIASSRQGNIWIGTNRGLSVFNGQRFRTLTPRDGLPDRGVVGISEDDAGDLWVAFAFRGFVRLQREEIARALSVPGYRIRYRVYNTSDGTAGFPYQPSRGNGARDQHGALWFVTTRGITIFDPARLRSEPAPPPVRALIEGVTADEARYGAATGTLLPPRTSRIRIDYTVVNTSLLDQTAAAGGVTPARIRFRYRLDGFDTDWIEGSGPRQALYMNLGPGQYRFRLQTAGDAAIWEDAETTWSFAIQPMFYETSWFRGLSVLAVVLGAVGAWRLRVRHLRTQFDLVFAERMRLSREIHDTLLQGMYGVALQVDAAAQHLPPSSPTLSLLQRVQRQIEDYIAEARQSLLNLRSERIEQVDLVQALRDTGDRLTAGQVPFIVNVTGTPRPCSPKVQKQILRIGCEAIVNAVRHSKARQIRMDVAFEDRLLHLRVADDGCGFNPADIDGSAHYGLLSMRERATDAGGRCVVESRPGAGVQVVAQFPILTSETT